MSFDDVLAPLRNMDYRIDTLENIDFQIEDRLECGFVGEFAFIAIFGRFAVVEMADSGDGEIEFQFAAHIESSQGAEGALCDDCGGGRTREPVAQSLAKP